MTRDYTPWLIVGAAAVAGVLLWRFSRQAGGLVTGNNPITTTATNAAGKPTTAYVGAGVVGTLGAAANAASGGTLASLGEGVGNWFYDLVNPAPSQPPAPTPAQASNSGQQGDAGTQASGWDYSGKTLPWADLASEGGWWPYGLQPLPGIPAGVS